MMTARKVFRSCSAIAALTTVALATGCGGFKPVPLDQTDVLERAETKRQGELSVTVAVPSVEEARALFDAKLHKKQIQPVWIRITNDGTESAWFYAHGVDPDYFPPLEVAWRTRRSCAKKTNQRINEFYYEQAIGDHIGPGETREGFVFVHLDLGGKYVPVTVYGGGSSTAFEFFALVPGLPADHAAVDFENLYAADEIRDLSDIEAVREWAASLPCCTQNKKGTKTGDPLNFVLVASDESFLQGFMRSRWDQTVAMSGSAKMKTASAAVFGKTYRNAPISPLYVLERPQDIGLQKARRSIHQRNHLRLWLAPVTYDGRYVWIGQISRDIGSRITTKSPTLTTHKIDPDIDDARNTLVLDLMKAGVLEAFGFTQGVGIASPDDPGRNLTGDPFFTDGLRVLLFLTETPTELEAVRYLEWEEPPKR